MDDCNLLDQEIKKLQFALDENQNENNNKNSTINWTPEMIATTRKVFVIAVVMMVLQIFNGVVPMSFYAANIFQETGSNLSPNMSAIVIGAIQLIGTCFATHLVDRSGRKVTDLHKVFS